MSDTTSDSRAIAATVTALPASAAERFAELVAARYKADGEWRELTYGEMVEAIDEIALGLVSLGIEVGDRVGILSDTRLEWTLASYGISVAGGVVVPVYPTNSPKECAWVLGNSGARAVFCENGDQRAKVEQVRDELPDLETMIGIEADGGEISLAELRERGRGQDRSGLSERRDAVKPEDAFEIIYTSGTTGPPKGVVLTHRNAMSVCEMVEELHFVQPGETTYLFLPLAHAFALTSQLASYDQGTMIVYFGGNTRAVLEEVVETHPTYLPSVPRIFEKLYTAAMKLAGQGSDEDRERFRQAIKLGVEVRQRRQRGEAVPDEMERAFEQADERLFSRVRAPVRRPHPPGRLRRRPHRTRDPGVLLRLRRAGARGLGDDRDHRRRHRGDAGPLQVRHRGPADAGRRDPDRRRRRDPDARAQRVPRVLAQPRGHRRDARRRLAAHRRSGPARRRGLPVDHRPQEGHHHHRRRQEPRPRQHRERPQAEPRSSPRRSCTATGVPTRWR